MAGYTTSPATAETAKRIAAGREHLKVLKDFIADIRNIGGRVPPGLSRAVDRYALAVNLGLDAAEAANEVDAELHRIYHDAYLICADMSGGDGTAEYWDCRTRVDRQWQRRNVLHVLDWNKDGSWVRRTWEKLRERLAKLLESRAKAKRTPTPAVPTTNGPITFP